MSRTLRLCTLLLLLPAVARCTDGVDGDLIVASGHVEATEVRIASKIGGTLETLAPDEGDTVGAGTVVGSIDTVDLALTLDAARADRRRAEAELQLLLAGTRDEEIAEAEAGVAQAQADLDGAQADFDRMSALLDSGTATAKERDDSLARRDMAAARLDAARERLRKLRAGSRREEIDAARAHVAVADATIAQIEQQIRDATILAPVSGIVTAKLAERGELVRAGAALLVVTDLADAWLNVWISEPDLARIRLGQTVEVHTDDGERREGRIKFVASEAEFTPKNVQTREERVKLVFRIKVALDNGDGAFKPGMPAEVRIRPAAAS